MIVSVSSEPIKPKRVLPESMIVTGDAMALLRVMARDAGKEPGELLAEALLLKRWFDEAWRNGRQVVVRNADGSTAVVTQT